MNAFTRHGWRALATAVVMAFPLAGAATAQEPVTVFAAASMTDAMERAGEVWRDRTGKEIRFSFASSSVLARQIEEGAPADIFISANESWMDYLAERDLIAADTRQSPIGNSLVLVAPADSDIGEIEITAETDFAGLLGDDNRLSVGDPDHVPAGRYAKAALESLGVWDELEPRLARADNVRAALALVETGEAPLGIVYSTDAAASQGVRVVGTFPADSHETITYPFAVVAPGDNEETRALFDFLTGDEAIAVYAEFGFTVD